MSTPSTKRITQTETIDTMTLSHFKQWCSEVCERVPIEHMHEARIEWDTREGYGGCFDVECTVSYHRPYTQEEIDAQEREIQATRERNNERDRKEFERLKAKFNAP